MSSHSYAILATAAVFVAGIACVSAQSTEPRICEEGGSGTFFPLSDSEYSWPRGLRIVLYFLGLMWCFLGVGVVTDVFMEAIEYITSKDVPVEVEGRHVMVRVWNATVANLSLMALGSSAPEIILSVVELTTDEFFSGSLGPSTIVGSAAFNLLFIIGVCTYSIPTGELRALDGLGVFAVTAACSMFAYIWLIVILLGTSPDVIEVWEAVLTLVFFPILLILSYMADKGRLICGRRRNEDQQVLHIEDGKGHVDYSVYGTRNFISHQENLKDETPVSLATKAAAQTGPGYSRAHYRINATRQLTGSSAIIPTAHTLQTDTAEDLQLVTLRSAPAACTISFASTKLFVLENEPEVMLTVERRGLLNQSVSVDYRTEDVTATAGEDYVNTSGTLTFEKNETEKELAIKILDDDIPENDEIFLVKLSNASPDHLVEIAEKESIAEVTIIDDDNPGELSIENSEYECMENCGSLKIKVYRNNGSSGTVGVTYRTQDGSAIKIQDYEETIGTLEFAPGVCMQTIEIPIVDDEEYEPNEHFFIHIENPTGMAKLGSHSMAKIVIIDDDDIKGLADKVTHLLKINRDKFRLGTSTWGEQFSDALEGPEKGSSVFAYGLHYISLPWKLLGACVPPTVFGGGWIAFVCALILIGLVTALIGDLASLMGCAMDLKDTVTAITFVALGTSLPDTFASRAAAVSSRSADAAITNVTGSNSVNVFLGLGLSWSIGAIYWKITGTTKRWLTQATPSQLADWPNGGVLLVQAGDLSFSVIIYSVCSVVAISVLMYRRKSVGAELGGPGAIYVAGGFIGLWVFYVLLSSLKAYGHI